MRVYVFGSNLEGRHGKGSALIALKHHGAIYGQGEGRQGNSYGIATKKTPYIIRSLDDINKSVQVFIQHAIDNPEDIFDLVRIGCMNAGYKDHQIAPMFINVPSNVVLPDEWKDVLGIKRGLTMDDLYNVE
jgi:hypothetical protein